MEVRCKFCKKLYALNLEGKLEWYCPKCKRYQITVDELIKIPATPCFIKDGYGKIA